MDRELKDSYERWLRGFWWDWWVTPSFRYPKTQHQAVAAVRMWLATMPDAYAAVAYERGPQGGRLHVHAVIGGIGQHPLLHGRLADSWRRGLIEVRRYESGRRGIRYMLDMADDPDGLELIGTPAVYTPRRRRGSEIRG